MWSDFADLGKRQNIPIFRQVLNVFSQQGGLIELIPFALGQASLDTSLEYPKHIIPRTLKSTFFRLTPLVGPLKLFFNEKKYFPLLSYI